MLEIFFVIRLDFIGISVYLVRAAIARETLLVVVFVVEQKSRLLGQNRLGTFFASLAKVLAVARLAIKLTLVVLVNFVRVEFTPIFGGLIGKIVRTTFAAKAVF